MTLIMIPTTRMMTVVLTAMRILMIIRIITMLMIFTLTLMRAIHTMTTMMTMIVIVIIFQAHVKRTGGKAAAAPLMRPMSASSGMSCLAAVRRGWGVGVGGGWGWGEVGGGGRWGCVCVCWGILSTFLHFSSVPVTSSWSFLGKQSLVMSE